MTQISTGALSALRRLAKIDHKAEMVFRGHANAAPIAKEEAIELTKAGLADLNGQVLRITAQGANRVDAEQKWPER